MNHALMALELAEAVEHFSDDAKGCNAVTRRFLTGGSSWREVLDETEKVCDLVYAANYAGCEPEASDEAAIGAAYVACHVSNNEASDAADEAGQAIEAARSAAHDDPELLKKLDDIIKRHGGTP